MEDKSCGKMRRRRVFPQLFRLLPNFHECYNNFMETREERFLFFFINKRSEKFLYFHRIMVNGLQPICARVACRLFGYK